MMLEEFERLTGIHPSALLYREIEKEYMNGPWEDKASFCKFYKKNQDGIAERCAHRADMAAFHLEVAHRKELDEAEKHGDEWRVRYEQAMTRLDRELGWTSYEDTRRMSNRDYNRLVAQTDSHELTDAEARDIIAEEFGFARELIEIVREVPALEVNKYHQIRTTGRMVDRSPISNSSDWNYIGFNCRGYAYELINGELLMV